MKLQPLVSLVILTYSERRIPDLLELLQSVNAQSYPNLEVIVVVERSNKIVRIAEGFECKYPKKIHFTGSKLGVSTARNLGVNISSGEIVAFVDDDAMLSSNWSEILITSFHDFPNVIGVTGAAIPLPKGTHLRVFPKALYWTIGCTLPEDSVRRYTQFVAGVNMAFRREAFSTHHFTINIFGDSHSRTVVHKGLPNDENDFAVRLTSDLHRPILFNPDLKVFHKVYSDRISTKFIKQYSFWQGFAEARYQTRPEWETARKVIRTKFLRVLLTDIVVARDGVTYMLGRTYFALIAALFTALGFLAYRNKGMYLIGSVLLQMN